MRLVRVAVPVPALDSLTYSVPDEFPMPPIGARVLVPLGSRVMTGCVLDHEPGSAWIRWFVRSSRRTSVAAFETRRRAPASLLAEAQAPSTEPDIKQVIDILDSTPFLPADIVKLTTWVSEDYAAGVGEAMAAAMPPRAWIESERYAQITDVGHARMLTERGSRRDILEALVDDKPVRVDGLGVRARGVTRCWLASSAMG